MKSIAISEFKAHCLALLEDVARSGQPLLVTRRGKPLARVVPGAGVDALYPQDTLEGSVTILGDVVAPAVPLSAFSAARGELWNGEQPSGRISRASKRAKRPSAKRTHKR